MKHYHTIIRRRTYGENRGETTTETMFATLTAAREDLAAARNAKPVGFGPVKSVIAGKQWNSDGRLGAMRYILRECDRFCVDRRPWPSDVARTLPNVILADVNACDDVDDLNCTPRERRIVRAAFEARATYAGDPRALADLRHATVDIQAEQFDTIADYVFAIVVRLPGKGKGWLVDPMEVAA